MAFQCSVATPEGLVFEGTITSAVVPAHDGQVGILTDRAPILLKLGAGVLTLQLNSNTERAYFVAGGVAQMKDNVLTILSDEATTTDKLDIEAARKDLAELAETGAGGSVLKARKLERARAILRTANVTA